MLESLISNISNQTIQDFFTRKILTYQPLEENLHHIIEDEERFSQFSDLRKLGQVAFDDSDELLVFSCQYNGELSERASKKKQFDIAKKMLGEDFKDGAIYIFYDANGNFRFSFIGKNYGESEKKYSNWKRYTYFVKPNYTNRTFIQRIEICNFNSLDSIIEAFSVEPLNKEFYDKIVKSFYSLVGVEVGSGRSKIKLEPNLTLPQGITDRKITRQFGVRLVGRIIFCWFLKHKTSKEGVPLIPLSWLRIENVETDYYHNRLEKLFFEILNKEIKNRKKLLPEGHEEIPFLNGGLFEPQVGMDSDFYDPYALEGSNYALKIKDDWFEQLFEILEQYNFTIDENSVNDAEVSIDPEMLGRIFENLLAEIDPNLEDSEKTSIRKATGSFYTPREIVEYMVEEALVKHLNNSTGFDEKRLHELFQDSTNLDFNELETNTLINEFNSIKILDPAAGSGAFPMGALHKIVHALQKLDTGAEIWKQMQLEKITNAALRSEMQTILDKSNAEYSRKLGVLQHCIYGADIQPIAAEISRLRSFLSLIVDEEIDDSKYNRGILALPNLDFKFVTANTLIRLANTGAIETNKVYELLPKMQKIRLDYLQAHGEGKEKLRKEFANIQNEIFKDQLQHNPDPNSRPMQLASWSPFKNEVAHWFDSEWMFGVKQFDIVIGNPPYGGTKISDTLKVQLGLGSKDPYGAFIARFLRRTAKYKGLEPEKTSLKHHGILSFIVSDTFMTIKSHKQLRDFMLENKLHSMLRVHPDTFKATVNTAIIVCERLEVPDNKTNKVLMADLTNTSIHNQHGRFMQLLNKVVQYKQPDYKGEAVEIDKVLFMKGADWTSESSEEYAIYTYPKKLIETNSNHPFFVASPKLFALMNDISVPKEEKYINGKRFTTNRLTINNKKINLIKLKDFAEINQGISTGDNKFYLRNKYGVGGYKQIDENLIVSNNDIEKFTPDEKQKGIDPIKYDGRHFIPFDKGADSDSSEGWMPNYFVNNSFYIDWSVDSVKRMESYTIKDRKVFYKEYDKIKKDDEKKKAAALRNRDKWFVKTINFSPTGQYSPSFRMGIDTVSQNTSSTILVKDGSRESLLGLLCSKFSKYI